MRSFRPLLVVMVWLAGASVGSMVGPTFAAFSATTENSGNSFAGAPDWAGPGVPAAVIQKGSGGIPGFIKQGSSYRVYALVVDAGNPPTGTNTVRANVSNVTSGQTAVAMSAGSWTVGGVTYNYRSGELTANTVLVDGPKTFSFATTDLGGNSRTVTGFSVAVDNIVPAGTDIQTTNVSGGTNGRAETGDTIVYTFTEQIEPNSILAAWDGSTTNVVVQIINNGANDLVQIWNAGNNTQLTLGQINTQGDYVQASLTFGASGTPSTMVQNGSVITITVGTVSDESRLRTNNLDTLLWTPAAGATDRAGNNCDVSVVTELGPLDPDF